MLLVKSNFKCSGQYVSSIKVNKIADDIMLKYDIYKDNHLSFSEFRYAVLENHL